MSYIDALNAERSMMVRQGKKDRVAAIDAELKAAGAAAPKPEAVEVAAVEAAETAARTRPVRKAAN